MTTAASDPIAELWREARSWLADAMHDFLGPAEIARTLARQARAAIKRRILLIESLLMKLLLIEAARLNSSPARGGGRELPRKREEREGDVRTRPSVSRHALDSSPQCGEQGDLKPAVRSQDPTNPQTWRVRFDLRIPQAPRLATPRPQNTGPRIRDLGRPLLVRDIWREQARRQRIARLHPKPDAAAAHARAQAKAAKLARRFEALRRVLADPRRAITRLARKLHALGHAARDFARRIALAPGPRRKRLGKTFASAIVYGCDASARFPADTS